MNTNSITQFANKVAFGVKKNSPTILVVTGIVTGVAATVTACRATTKLNDILEKSKNDVELIHGAIGDETLPEKYTEEDAKKDLIITYTKTGVEIIKLYAPAAGMGLLAIGCILKSHDILSKRNASIAAAYAVVDASYKKYRERVVDRFGEQVDKELKYGIKAKKITETVVDEETGKEKKVKKSIDVVEDPNVASEYARFFEEYTRDEKGNVIRNMAWEADSQLNLAFLLSQQAYANQLLEAKGYVFLNEVYDLLCLPRSQAGNVVGWKYDKDSNGKGDNHISFGIHRDAQNYSDFIYNDEEAILLDFNVDGVILDELRKY